MKSTDSLRRSYAMAKFFTYFFLILGAVIMIFPFLWMILTSSKTVPESMLIPPTFRLYRRPESKSQSVLVLNQMKLSLLLVAARVIILLYVVLHHVLNRMGKQQLLQVRLSIMRF